MYVPWETIVPVAVSYLGIGVLLGSVAVLIAVNAAGTFSARARLVLLVILGVFVAAAVRGLFGMSDGLGSQVVNWAGDAGAIVTIGSMLVLDRQNARKAVVNRRLLLRVGWIVLGVSVLFEVAWYACLYFVWR